MDVFSVFDAWEPLLKARKPKGLSKWTRLSHLSDKLEGKGKKAIAYTCAHDSHKGAEHVLGSVVGNLHFLMGYANPGFHLAPYHFQVIDPSVDDEEAEELYHVRGHPSRPQLWERSELDAEAEGDLEEGEPHPTYAEVREKIKKQKKRESESIRVQAGVGTYVAVPSEGLVYGEHNNHVYKWEMIRDSFLAAAHPEMAEAMEEAAEEKSDVEKEVDKSFDIAEALKYKCESGDFEDEVYPLVKSVFPVPGSVVPIKTTTDETIYGLVNKGSIDFCDKVGLPVKILVYDALYDHFDLLKSGNTHSSILYNFAISKLGVDKEELEQFVVDDGLPGTPMIVKGFPTPGFDDEQLVEHDEFEREVKVSGNTFRVSLRSSNES